MNNVKHLLKHCISLIGTKFKKHTMSSTLKRLNFLFFSIFKYYLFRASRIILMMIIDFDVFVGNQAIKYSKMSDNEYNLLIDYFTNEF